MRRFSNNIARLVLALNRHTEALDRHSQALASLDGTLEWIQESGVSVNDLDSLLDAIRVNR